MSPVSTVAVPPQPLAVPRAPLMRLVPAAAPAMRDAERDQDFMEMLRTFRNSGGIARGDEVVEMLQAARSFDVSHLARGLVNREILSFEWHDELWLPLFQFDLRDMTLRETPQRITAELSCAFDGWALAQWFVTPNSWLAGRMPVEVIGDYPADVFHAARADRFVAMG